MEFGPEQLAACRVGTLFGSPRSDPVGMDEPLRLLLTDHWDLDGAHRELTRWLKSLPRTEGNRKNRKTVVPH